MPILNTSTLSDDISHYPPTTIHQLYCGLDNCITNELRLGPLEQLRLSHPTSQPIYSFERALQAPYLEIMLRGFLVNEAARLRESTEIHRRIDSLQLTLNQFSLAVWPKTLNPRSYTQLKDFFYGTLKLPEVWRSQKGIRKLSLNRETLEKLFDTYLYSRPFINCILAIRDLAKQLDIFDSEIDSDSRFRTSYNIAGTETGRPSSSKNAFGTGGNAQNIAPSLRYIFISDPGKKLCVIDYEQVETRDEGWFCGCLFNDWSLLDACESGDFHTTNATKIWPELPWSNDLLKSRQIADQLFYRTFTYRDMSKRGGHLTNYMGTSWTAARALKVPQKLMEDFQSRYCRGPNCAYPCIPLYWQWIAEQIQTTHSLTTPFGRQRHFFGRPEDDATIREGIAFMPQSTTADRTNLGLWRVWKYMPNVQLLAQTFDSITFQFDETEDEDEIISKALKLLEVEFTHPNGRKYVVPGEAKVGWNWGNYTSREDVEKAVKAGRKPPRLNLEGLKKWKAGVKDERVRAKFH